MSVPLYSTALCSAIARFSSDSMPKQTRVVCVCRLVHSPEIPGVYFLAVPMLDRSKLPIGLLSARGHSETLPRFPLYQSLPTVGSLDCTFGWFAATSSDWNKTIYEHRFSTYKFPPDQLSLNSRLPLLSFYAPTIILIACPPYVLLLLPEDAV